MIVATHPELGTYHLAACRGRAPALLFTENESNTERLFGIPNATPYVKDGINAYVVRGAGRRQPGAERDEGGRPLPPGGRPQGRAPPCACAWPADRRRRRRRERRSEAAGRHSAARSRPCWSSAGGRRTPSTPPCTPPAVQGTDAGRVLRQALAGMLWSKQYYYFDLDRWLEEHEGPPPGPRSAWTCATVTGSTWSTTTSSPCRTSGSTPGTPPGTWPSTRVALAMVDLDFAKEQLELMLRELYLHPNGQIPAYEWNFGDVNPPVHAWAVLFAFRTERERRGQGDLRFLRSAFHKLLVNFTWWINRKDPTGRNVFEGGFLGLDNIGVFDRSAPLPTGGRWSRRTGRPGWPSTPRTCWRWPWSWRRTTPSTRTWRSSSSSTSCGSRPRWIVSGTTRTSCGTRRTASSTTSCACPDGRAQRLKVRSMVGLLPMCATTVVDADRFERFPQLLERFVRFLRIHPELQENIAPLHVPGVEGRRLLGALSETKLRRVLGYLLDEAEFLGPYGVRALSRYHAGHPYVAQRAGAGVPGGVPAGGVDLRPLRGQLQLAGPRVVPAERPPDPLPAAAPQLLRGRLHRGVPHRLGPAC